jgi:ATP-dependent exoDNAse (exonuclease V) beta subunit
MSKNNTVLSTNNGHSRDKNILFQEIGHKYTIMNDPYSKYTSVTTWNHSHFPKFDSDDIIQKMMKGKSWKEGHKYWGLNVEQIKELWEKNRNNAAGAGTNIHYEIECFMNDPNLQRDYTHKELFEENVKQLLDASNNTNTIIETDEWNYFINFVKDFPELKPYRTEWMIYDEEVKLAGSIDMVYENPDGTLSIYDWKRSANITKINAWNKFAIPHCISQFPDSNFWHYALQLNTYKTILERKYDKKIKDLYLVRLHPESEEKTYELLSVPILEKEMSELFDERKKHLPDI